MHRLIGLMFASAFLVSACVQSALAQSPPKTPKKPVSDTHHGVKVTDDYRWLEKSDDPAVKKWLDEQNAFTRDVLDSSPGRKPIEAALKKLIAAPGPSYFRLEYRKGMLFALKDAPPKEQPILVVLKSADEPESANMIVDPNALDPKGKTTIDFYTPSPDGKYVAVSLSEGGSEEGTLHVFETATGKKLKDVIPRASYPTAGGCVAWDVADAGREGPAFFYTRYPRAGERSKEDLNFHVQVYRHKLGTLDKEDVHVIGKDFPRIAEVFLDVSPGGELLVTLQKGDGGEFEHHFRGKDGVWQQLTRFGDEVNAMAFDTTVDQHLYVLTRNGAPRGRIERVALDSPGIMRRETAVKESDVNVVGLQWRGTRMVPSHVPAKTGLYVLDVVGGPSQVRFVSRIGRVTQVPLPPVAAVHDIVRLEDDDVLLSVGAYTEPPAWYRYRPGDKELKKTALFKKAAASFDDIEVTRRIATSKDGTKVPLTIMHKKGLALDGKNPALLYAYGGYSITLSPAYDASRRLWFDHGGVFAIANLRGGGEYGDSWHKAAVLTKRQNAYDDFFACAQLLVDEKYTNPGRLAIEGASNGGLLMGVALTQRPELFRAVVAHVGIYDMLRFELHPNGEFNVTEFGSVKDLDQFKALHAYSPLHNVKDGTAYPAVFLLTGANDGRVDPANSYKMAARLQAATSSKRPVFLRVTFDAGHGLGESLSGDIDRATDVYGFLFEQLGMRWKER